MTMRLAPLSRSAAADAVVDRVDSGGGAGVLKLYTGAVPTNVTDAATGTLLATITLAATAFGSAATGVATAASMPRTGTAVATGTAGYGRVETSAGLVVWDGSVTATGAGGDVQLASTSIVADTTVSVTSITYTQPQ